MKTRLLRDLEVSAIGYGCMGLSHGYGAAPERSESIRLIQSAFDLGCTFFDTAEGYGAGNNERIVGEAVKPFRHKIVLATKLHLNKREGDTATVIRRHLEASLKRLGTDYVDLYYQHRIEDDDMVEEVAAAMGELIREGKIRGWGQSQAREDQVRRANAVRRVITRFAPENMERNQPLLDLLQHLAQEKEATPAQISLAWMLHKKDFIVPIPGMRKVERMEENFGADGVTLTVQLLMTRNGFLPYSTFTQAGCSFLFLL